MVSRYLFTVAALAVVLMRETLALFSRRKISARGFDDCCFSVDEFTSSYCGLASHFLV